MLDSNKSTNFNKKSHFKEFFYVSYDTYDFMIYTICTLYHTIHEHLRYANTIWNILHTIRYISYDTYRVSYNTDNYTPDIVSKVLHVPKVAHPNYPGCDHLRTVSKDELSSLFCETLLSWGDRQNTPCSGFAKGLRFLKMVMTFILHPLSHYNSITGPHARFLLSLLEDISIYFPSHFILSLIDVYRDAATRDKLIFPSTVMRLLRHFSISFLESPRFSVMSAIDAATVRRSEAQLRSKRPRIETATPPASTAPSTSALSSSAGEVTIEAIMAQLVCMDACLDTLSDELCQVNTRVGHIS